MDTAAYSVREWCRRRGICAATFYNRLPHGEMPAIVKIGRRTIITAEADQEWRRRMEKATGQQPAYTGGRS
jgi:predicted DNA-binding transcriptional regulator AlpA